MLLIKFLKQKTRKELSDYFYKNRFNDKSVVDTVKKKIGAKDSISLFKASIEEIIQTYNLLSFLKDNEFFRDCYSDDMTLFMENIKDKIFDSIPKKSDKPSVAKTKSDNLASLVYFLLNNLEHTKVNSSENIERSDQEDKYYGGLTC